MKRIVTGIVAHVDAGKTTLAEGILYTGGQTRSLGRVDHEDAFLDHFALERARGITIFSKQARVQYKDIEFVLVDTPGHVDFSAEMERTLQILDVAILVISASDLVTGHVETLWTLLRKYKVPVILFINKMDLPGTNQEEILGILQKKLHPGCIPYEEAFLEEIASNEENLMEEYLETDTLSLSALQSALQNRVWFPCFFGAALRLDGVEELLDGMNLLCSQPEYGKQFGAKVYKIGRDDSGVRLSYLKVTGGTLNAKQVIGEEKIDFVKRINGASMETVTTVEAGDLCAVTGLRNTYSGQGLGCEQDGEQAVLEPVLTYQLILPEDMDATRAMPNLRKLEEEEPMLRLQYEPHTGEIHVQVMGEVQMEILKVLVKERFGMDVSFDQGSILYRETIAEEVEGIGHYEPLRHYAEVHLKMEPLETGMGLQFATEVSVDDLDLNWQRLVLTHLEEKEYVGVLTGSPITDMRITLVAGRAHLKHTEGGDFRQATYRAVRQGLRKAQSLLLEPYFAFRLEVPMDAIGRSMTDITRRCGTFEQPVLEGDRYILTGEAPVETLRDYEKEVASYTGGLGRLVCRLCGYKACHNMEEVVERIGYNPDEDTRNPDSSVFCAHGAGFLVPWYQVDDYAHVGVEAAYQPEEEDRDISFVPMQGGGSREARTISLEEIEDIFRTSYGTNVGERNTGKRYHKSKVAPQVNGKPTGASKPIPAKKQCLIVDGYNILFAWEELNALSKINIDSARDRLIDMMCGYQGILGYPLILVFDAYKVKGNPGSAYEHHNIYVVYTKEAQTADQYIEKTVHEMAREYRVTVATSDRLEQMVIFGDGALRVSAREFYEHVTQAARLLRQEYGIGEEDN